MDESDWGAEYFEIFPPKIYGEDVLGLSACSDARGGNIKSFILAI